MMEEHLSHVYIKIDSNNRVIQIEGEYSLSNLSDLSECILIEEGIPCKRLNLAQTCYLDKPIYESHGIPRYKYVDGQIVERTQEEIESDIPQPEPTEQEKMNAQTLYTAIMTGTLIEEG